MTSEKKISLFNSFDIKKTELFSDNLNINTYIAGNLSSSEMVIYQINNQNNETKLKVVGCDYMITLVLWYDDIYLSNNKFDINLEFLINKFNLPTQKIHCAITLLEIIEQIQS